MVWAVHSIMPMVQSNLPAALLLLGASSRVWQHMVHHQPSPYNTTAGSNMHAWVAVLSEVCTLAAMLWIAWRTSLPMSTLQVASSNQEPSELPPAPAAKDSLKGFQHDCMGVSHPDMGKPRGEPAAISWATGSEPDALAAPLVESKYNCDGPESSWGEQQILTQNLQQEGVNEDALASFISGVLITQEAQSVSGEVLSYGQVQVMVVTEQRTMEQQELNSMLPSYECKLLTMVEEQQSLHSGRSLSMEPVQCMLRVMWLVPARLGICCGLESVAYGRGELQWQGLYETALPLLCNVHLYNTESGKLALAYLHTCGQPPDLVLLSLTLHGVPALELILAIRSKWSSSALPIILVSNADQHQLLEEGLEAGANDYVVKPFRRLELACRLQTHLALRKAINLADEAGRNLSLLRSILPKSIISKLKRGNQLVAEYHEQVTILFTDIKGFTTMAQEWPTERIILMLNEMFTAFDQLCMSHDVYKVETIGDAYMVVSGHDGKQDHAVRMMNMAAAMINTVQNMTRWAGKAVEIRVGVHTGPAHSGVVGVLRPHYSFFGDTVNTASRMESNGFPMAVHVSEATCTAVEQWQAHAGQTHHTFVECGPRSIKGKGIMHTHVLKVGNWQEALMSLASEKQAIDDKVMPIQGLTNTLTAARPRASVESGNWVTTSFMQSTGVLMSDAGPADSFTTSFSTRASSSTAAAPPAAKGLQLRSRRHSAISNHSTGTCTRMAPPAGKHLPARRVSMLDARQLSGAGSAAGQQMNRAYHKSVSAGVASQHNYAGLPAWPPVLHTTAADDSDSDSHTHSISVPGAGKSPSAAQLVYNPAFSSSGHEINGVLLSSPAGCALLPADSYRLRLSSRSSIMDLPSSQVNLTKGLGLGDAKGADELATLQCQPAGRKPSQQTELPDYSLLSSSIGLARPAVGAWAIPALRTQPSISSSSSKRTFRKSISESRLRPLRSVQTAAQLPCSAFGISSTSSAASMKPAGVPLLTRTNTMKRADAELMALLHALGSTADA